MRIECCGRSPHQVKHRCSRGSAAPGSCSVRRRFDLIRLRAFRWPLVVAGAVTLLTILLFAFLYWQTRAYLIANMDNVVTSQADYLVTEADGALIRALDDRLSADPRHVRLTGLFDADGRPILGNLAALPPDLPIDGPARHATLTRIDQRGPERQEAPAVPRTLPTSKTLAIGRPPFEIEEID